jgi:hypothetical protein
MPPPAGLCDRCRYQRIIRNTRGSSFSLCERAREDDRFEKYPRLPVLRCPGFEEGGLSAPETASAPTSPRLGGR